MIKRLLITFFVLLTLMFTQSAKGQHYPQLDRRLYVSDSIVIHPRRPWLAAGEAFGVNMLVWGFNRFVTNEDFARINGKSIKRNFKTGPVWDTDKFSTNLVAHPYHGSLYYNAARSNGMNFWQSIPFTFGGSLMWEFFMETEPPSINDLFATTFGGVALGEITYRLSDLFIDNRTTGAERVGRELLSGVISPIRALNRIITGEMWKTMPSKGRTFRSVPINFVVGVGPRFLAEEDRSSHGVTSMNVSLRLNYGDPHDDEFYSPYEWFQLQASFDFFSKQPLVSQVNAVGALWGKPIWKKGARALTLGIFQHFDYYDSQLRSKSGDLLAPYRISQAAAVGGGLIYKKSSPENNVEVFADFYQNAVILGASASDHFMIDERDYNLGSGYSTKAFFTLVYNKRWLFSLNTENYHIYTWKGYKPDIDWSTVDYETLNVQGDKSNAQLSIFSAQIGYFSDKKWNLTLTNRYFSRETKYKYFDDVNSSTMDVMLTLGVGI
ncbi:DUF3943 domain-containing protein [Parabacteroides sp. PH5-16]